MSKESVEIITIGDELLIGQTVDTNSAWIGQELTKVGFSVTRKVAIQDSKDEIVNAVTSALSRVDIVLVTGGLGPTKDDITKITLAEYFDSELIFNQDVYGDIKAFLGTEDQGVNDLNRDQALVPDKCTVIRNKIGTAPTMYFKNKSKSLFSMPGVPYEMKEAMKTGVIPEIIKNHQSNTILNRTVMVSGIPESDIAIRIKKIENDLPNWLSLAYLPSPQRVKLRLTGRGLPIKEMDSKISEVFNQVKKILGSAMWNLDDTPPEIVIKNILQNSGLTISTAESCTGGNIAHKITSIAGSSEYFYGSVVSYDNSIKMNVLGVKKSDLDTYGAVSKEVVEQMALGVQKLCKTEWSVATSGVAGPGGGTQDKPVGTVWLAWAGPNGVESRKFKFGKLREQNIISATETALVGLINRINS